MDETTLLVIGSIMFGLAIAVGAGIMANALVEGFLLLVRDTLNSIRDSR